MVAIPQALLDEIAARADETEQARRLPTDLAEKMAAAGLFRLCVPKSLGGAEVSAATVLKTIERVATVDGSIGWAVLTHATAALTAAYLPEEAARTIYGDAMAITAGAYAPRGVAETVEGGYRVTGRWPWASGNAYSHWLMGGCIVMEDGKPRLLPNGVPDVAMMFFPSAKTIRHDNWFSSGLCGTGSGDIEVVDLFVPSTHAAWILGGKPRETGPLYALSMFGLLAGGLAAVSLGIARGAIEAVVTLAGGKVPLGSRRTLAQRGVAQAEIAKAEALVQSARAYLHAAIGHAWAAAERGEAMTQDLRAQMRLAATHATDSAARAVDIAYGLAGGSSVQRISPLQRHFRDVHAVTQHAMVAAPLYESVGRIIFKLPTDMTTL